MKYEQILIPPYVCCIITLKIFENLRAYINIDFDFALYRAVNFIKVVLEEILDTNTS